MQSELTDKELDEARRCRYGSAEFLLTATGVYYLGKDKEGNALPPLWLCSYLSIAAMTRDEHGNEWGRLLEWKDEDGIPHQWAVPLEAMEGDGSEVRRELARQGLRISHNRGARDLLCAYIKAWPVKARARSVDRLGWHGSVYVCADQIFGETDERHIYQNAHAIQSAMQASGTLLDWQSHIAKPALGNSRLVFAISLALAGPLVRMAGADSGGFHLRGQSSSGKSTALCIAASVWGKPSEYVRLWRSTTNGLEGLASLHNDGVLVLDELSQIDPEAAGEAIYLLANGQGKTRASKLGAARPVQQWRILFLSAGEESLVSLMSQGRKRTTAGQETRLADIPADAGAEMGVFECLHESPSPNAFAQSLKQASANYYGSAGQAWLGYLVRHIEPLPERLRQGIRRFVEEVAPKGAGGQVQRVAARFGLIAIAGELASHAGISGWPEGTAYAAAKTCFAAWLDSFGGAGNQEERAIVQQTLAFLGAHGNSRFEYLPEKNGSDYSYSQYPPNTEKAVYNRAGFWRNGADGRREYLMMSGLFEKEICQGYDKKLVKDTLIRHGILIPNKNRTPTQQARLEGANRKVYVLRYPDEE